MSEDKVDDADQHPPETGLDLARAIAAGLRGKTRRRRKQTQRPTATPERSGARPDDRDPQTLDASMQNLIRDRGWDTDLRVHGVFSRWPAMVGQEVADHSRPEAFADGRLVVRTDSTAWATQMRLLAGNLLRRLNEELGEGTVTHIDILGPRAPRWTSGRLRVRGRGPRDTYG